jgi:antitoxin component YwqK of YwqJK toxin-antitoxin module
MDTLKLTKVLKCIAVLISLLMFVSCKAQKSKVHKTFYDSGELQAVTEMMNGKKNGKESIYLKNGDLFMVQYYKDDMPVDSFFQYDDGKIVIRGYCTPRAHVVLLDSSGNTLIGENDYKAKTIGDGLSKLYYHDGKVWSMLEYSDGKKHGVAISYFSNGNVKQITHYRNNIQVPPLISFDSLGNVKQYTPIK